MLRKILNVIDRCIGYLLVVLFAVTVLRLFFQVIMRYVFCTSTIWAEELAIFSIIWMCSLGCALAFRRYKHITITTIADMIPWKIRRFIDIASYVLILVFLAYAFSNSFASFTFYHYQDCRESSHARWRRESPIRPGSR